MANVNILEALKNHRKLKDLFLQAVYMQLVVKVNFIAQQKDLLKILLRITLKSMELNFQSLDMVQFMGQGQIN